MELYAIPKTTLHKLSESDVPQRGKLGDRGKKVIKSVKLDLRGVVIDDVTCSVAHMVRQSTSNSFFRGLPVVKEEVVVEIAGEGKALEEIGTPAVKRGQKQ